MSCILPKAGVSRGSRKMITEREIEQAWMDLAMEAKDSQGRKVILGGSMSKLRRDLVEISGWFAKELDVTPLEGEIAALRNLELVARAYRLGLEGERDGLLPKS